MEEADFIGTDDVNQTVNGSIASNRWAIRLSSTHKRAVFAMPLLVNAWAMSCAGVSRSFAWRGMGRAVEGLWDHREELNGSYPDNESKSLLDFFSPPPPNPPALPSTFLCALIALGSVALLLGVVMSLVAKCVAPSKGPE